MLARLILVLLLAAFAVPAAAASGCHDAGMSAPAAHHGDTGNHRAPDTAITAHVCIGCIPPGDWTAARVFAPVSAPALRRVFFQQAFAAGIARAPAIPPPRPA